MKIKAKLAKYEEIEEILNLIKDIPSNYDLVDLAPYDEEVTSDYIKKAIDNNLCFITRDINDELESIMVLSISSTWWSDKDHITNDIIYAREGKFRKDILKEYLAVIDYIVKNNDLPFMFSMLNYHYNGKDDINKKEQLFLKMLKGSRKIGATLLYTGSNK